MPPGAGGGAVKDSVVTACFVVSCGGGVPGGIGSNGVPPPPGGGGGKSPPAMPGSKGPGFVNKEPTPKGRLAKALALRLMSGSMERLLWILSAIPSACAALPTAPLESKPTIPNAFATGAIIGIAKKPIFNPPQGAPTGCRQIVWRRCGFLPGNSCNVPSPSWVRLPCRIQVSTGRSQGCP